MAQITLTDFAGLPEHEHSALGKTVAKHRDLDDVFAWGRSQSPAVRPADVVKQDEFTHDVLVPLPNGRWLVYGTT